MTAELQAKLAARISREYFLSEDAAKKQAREMVRNCPDLLQKNLEQWAAGEPLTEISIDGYSVPMLLHSGTARIFSEQWRCLRSI